MSYELLADRKTIRREYGPAPKLWTVPKGLTSACPGTNSQPLMAHS
jgi:hypothetical protein